ncbi:MAG: hypothetical protein J6U52_05780 [Alistipes sp.]|nr:hypothetical protein [Alistipes sp.]
MKEIKAKKGYYLTQSADVADENRIFVTAIKGANVNEADWQEATAEERDAHINKMTIIANEEVI